MKLSKAYVRASEFLDEEPNPREDWGWILIIGALGYCCAFALRAMNAGRWFSPGFMAGGQVIMSTHDAYCWLAGAKGVNAFGEFGMSALARGLAALFSVPLWKIGFWAPIFLGSLVAPATALWGWLLAGRRGCIAAACLGALAPGFYFRSRLGYYDSDAFTLLMPLLLGFCLAHLLSPVCTRAWRPTEAERRRDAAPSWLPWLALGYGLLARVAHFAHDDIHLLGVILLWLALAVVLIAGRPGRRAAGLRLLLVYALAGYGGTRRFGMDVFRPGAADWACILLAAAAAELIRRRPARLRPFLDNFAVLAAALLCAAALGHLFTPFGAFWSKAGSYLKPALETGGGEAAAAGPVYPGITQSIREARNAGNLAIFLEGMALSPGIGLASLCGVLALLVFRPAMVFLLPLAGIGAASLLMGVRFAMFGGPACALGLGIGLDWLLKAIFRPRSGAGEGILWGAQVFLASAGIFLYASLYAAFPPAGVLSPQHALALMHLKRISPKNAEVWTWWDYGYATQYFAERMTPIDGGRHAGRDIYPTALAMITPNFRQSAQTILLSAGLGYAPYRRWDAMPARTVLAELRSLGTADRPVRKAPPQYLVVAWDDMNLLRWLAFYGTWDVVRGAGTHADVRNVGRPFKIDTETGLMTIEGRAKPLYLSSVDRLTARGARRYVFPGNPDGPHLLLNEANGQAQLQDDLAYDSVTVQLLIGNPERPEAKRYFKLVHDGFPIVRIYEVLPPGERPAGREEAITQ